MECHVIVSKEYMFSIVFVQALVFRRLSRLITACLDFIRHRDSKHYLRHTSL